MNPAKRRVFPRSSCMLVVALTLPTLIAHGAEEQSNARGNGPD